VTFALDANGILQVRAKDLDTGKENKIEIKGSSGLAKDEVERMRREAESHAAEDHRRVELISARNEADSAIYSVEKVLKEHADKISAKDKDMVQVAINRLRDKMKEEDTAAIKRATEELAQAAQGLAAAVQGGGPRPGAAGAAPSGDGAGKEKGGKDDVIDAEFEVKG
jgi:molecular chaperone DnaK